MQVRHVGKRDREEAVHPLGRGEQGTVRADVVMADVMTLANAISLAAQPADATKAERLLALSLAGIQPPAR
ncbi:hypothetical protein AB0I95_11025 [Micromonospora sp. NPDC049751]|uniref:SbtR family transcriptional regulator n=1 Tax=Micromonospora sp. NPDC049751 TaxID=3154837 RepID=UPI0033E1624B